MSQSPDTSPLTGQVKPGEISKHLVVLPCKAEDLHSFISGLLGRPQTITKVISGPFDVGKEEIENFYHLIDQRVQQQNQAGLVSFTVRIVMSDGSSVLCHGLDDFSHYHEVRAVASDAVHLSWSYLITFPGRTVPEKQQIDITIRAGASISYEDDDILFERALLRSSHSAFRFRIEHTARTWGADLEALLTAHIQGLVLPQHPARRFLRDHSGFIALATSLLFLASCVAGGFYVVNTFAQGQLARIAALEPLRSSTTDDLALQVYRLLEMSASGAWPKLTLYLVVFILCAAFAAIVLGLWQATALDHAAPSFVRITKEAERRKLRLLNRERRSLLMAALSLASQVGIGVVASALFSWLTSP